MGFVNQLTSLGGTIIPVELTIEIIPGYTVFSPVGMMQRDLAGWTHCLGVSSYHMGFPWKMTMKLLKSILLLLKSHEIPSEIIPTSAKSEKRCEIPRHHFFDPNQIPWSHHSSPLPSGKQTKNYGKSPFFMGESTISMAIFYVANGHKLPEVKSLNPTIKSHMGTMKTATLQAHPVPPVWHSRFTTSKKTR